MINNKTLTRLKKGKIYFCLFLILLCFFAFTFRADLVGEVAYNFTLTHINTESKNLVEYTHNTYGTERTFNKNAFVFAESAVKTLKSKGEFAVVKIRGEYDKAKRQDYVLISDDSVIALNINVYIAKNADIGNYSLPAVTVFSAVRLALETVALAIFVIIFIILFYKIARYFGALKKGRQCKFYLQAKKRISKTVS